MIAIAFISNGDGLSLSLLKSPSWENNRAIQNPAALHSSTLLSRVTVIKIFQQANCFQCGSQHVFSVAGFEMKLSRHISHYLITYYLPSGEDDDDDALVISFKPEEIIMHFCFRLVCGRFLDQFCCSSWGHSWKNGKKYNYFFSVSMIFDIFHAWMFGEKKEIIFCSNTLSY